MVNFTSIAAAAAPYIPSAGTLKATGMSALTALTSTTGLVVIGALSAALLTYAAFQALTVFNNADFGNIDFEVDSQDDLVLKTTDQLNNNAMTTRGLRNFFAQLTPYTPLRQGLIRFASPMITTPYKTNASQQPSDNFAFAISKYSLNAQTGTPNTKGLADLLS